MSCEVEPQRHRRAQRGTESSKEHFRGPYVQPRLNDSVGNVWFCGVQSSDLWYILHSYMFFFKWSIPLGSGINLAPKKIKSPLRGFDKH
jgi:hypothetical protein